MRNLARIFLSRSTASLYVGCQFLLLYGLLPLDISAPFVYALMCVGFIPLADLTLSVNGASFRQYAGSDPSFVTALIIVLCVLTLLSAAIVLAVVHVAMNPDPHTLGSRIFFYLTCVVVTINMAIPLFYECGANYIRIMKLIAISDLVALGLAAIMVFVRPDQALIVAAFTRLLLSLASLLHVGGRRGLSYHVAAFQWWRDRVRARPRFIAIQIVSVTAGAALFSFPAIFLLSTGGEKNFMQFALAMALSNIIVSMLSSFFATRTDVLLRAASGKNMSDRLHNTRRTLLLVFVFFVPTGIMAVGAIQFLNEFASAYFNLTIFNAFSPAVAIIAMLAGYFNLASQVVAMGQRIRGFDSFALPALLLGTVNIIVLYQFGTSALSVAIISACISVVGFMVGSIINRGDA